MIVAYLDDPRRFRNARQVSSYAGLVPRRYQSGQMDRQGRIHKRGPRLLRSALVEAAWVMLRLNPWARALYDRLCAGQKTRRKKGDRGRSPQTAGTLLGDAVTQGTLEGGDKGGTARCRYRMMCGGAAGKRALE